MLPRELLTGAAMTERLARWTAVLQPAPIFAKPSREIEPREHPGDDRKNGASQILPTRPSESSQATGNEGPVAGPPTGIGEMTESG